MKKIPKQTNNKKNPQNQTKPNQNQTNRKKKAKKFQLNIAKNSSY